MNIEFGLTAEDYAKHRAGFPDIFFERVFGSGVVRAGDSLIDLGTGTGTLARGFAARGCRVTGLDVSGQLLAQADRMSRTAGLKVEFRQASAENTGLPAGSFDVVTAGQCWHWFKGDHAALEVKRLLKPGGQILIAHFDWLPLTDTIVDHTEKLIRRFNPEWYERFGNKDGMYPQWCRQLGEAGFRDIRTWSVDVNVPYTTEAWRGRIRASSGVGASLSREQVAKFDSEFKTLLEKNETASEAGRPPGGHVWQIPHRVFAVHAAKP